MYRSLVFGAGVERQKWKGDREPGWGAAVGQAGGALPRGEEDRMLAEVRCPRPCTDQEQERVLRDGQGARRVPGEGDWGQEPRGKNPNRSISSHHQEDGREGEN